SPARGPFDWRLGPAAVREAAPTPDATDGAADALEGDDAVAHALATRVVRGELVGWMRGRLGFGVDAVSGRDVLADPRSAASQERLRRDLTRADALSVPGAVCRKEALGELFTLEADGQQVMERGGPARPKGDPARFLGVTGADGRVSVRGVDVASDPVLHDVLGRVAGEFGV